MEKYKIAVIAGDGIVLIDTGYPYMYEQILDSMNDVGLDVMRVTAIFHSHGHYDHYGCTERLAKLTGAKTYISRIDNEIVNGTLDLSFAAELGFDRIPAFDCDVLIDPGDEFTFGRTKIRCEAAPGHTDGTLAFFITVPEGEGYITAAMHGGLGLGSMSHAFLSARGLSLDCRRKFVEGLHRLAKETPDLVLGNHPEQNGTQKKLLLKEAGECILNPEEWGLLLASAERSLVSFIDKEEAKK